MAKPERGEAEIKIGDEVYTARFGTSALRRLERATGKGINRCLRELQAGDGFMLDTAVWFVWAALQEHHPGVTDDMVADWLDEYGADAVLMQINEAFAEGQPEAPAVGARPRKRDQAKAA